MRIFEIDTPGGGGDNNKGFLAPNEEIYNEVAKVLVTECRPYFDAINNDLSGEWCPWRGTKVKFPQVMTRIHPRGNRRPKDTNQTLHFMVDQWLYDTFGIRYRSQGVFASGDLGMVYHYGHPHLMFPVGDFSFVWSMNYDDLTARLQLGRSTSLVNRVGRELGYDYDAITAPENKNEIINLITDYIKDNPEILFEFLENGVFTSENLIAALNSGNEISFACNEYIIVRIGRDDSLLAAAIKRLL